MPFTARASPTGTARSATAAKQRLIWLSLPVTALHDEHGDLVALLIRAVDVA